MSCWSSKVLPTILPGTNMIDLQSNAKRLLLGILVYLPLVCWIGQLMNYNVTSEYILANDFLLLVGWCRWFSFKKFQLTIRKGATGTSRTWLWRWSPRQILREPTQRFGWERVACKQYMAMALWWLIKGTSDVKPNDWYLVITGDAWHMTGLISDTINDGTINIATEPDIIYNL